MMSSAPWWMDSMFVALSVNHLALSFPLAWLPFLIILSEVNILSGTITKTVNSSITVSSSSHKCPQMSNWQSQGLFLFSGMFYLTVLIGWMRLTVTEALKDRGIRRTSSSLLYSEDEGPTAVCWHHSGSHQQRLDHLSATWGRGGNAAASESWENLAAEATPYFCSLSFDSQPFPANVSAFLSFKISFFSVFCGHYLQILWYYLWKLHSLVISALWAERYHVCFHHNPPTHLVKSIWLLLSRKCLWMWC